MWGFIQPKFSYYIMATNTGMSLWPFFNIKTNDMNTLSQVTNNNNIITENIDNNYINDMMLDNNKNDLLTQIDPDLNCANNHSMNQ